MSAIEDLEAAFETIQKAVSDAVAKLQEQSAALASAVAANDPAKIESIAQELTATAASLESAVNPPAAPAPVVPVSETPVAEAPAAAPAAEAPAAN
ncbi:hypothetical protein SAMN06265338_11524 [Rhodoblastus acidophilus]|uniref:Uncharacterized protein n=1 Tax=Rhodoblastus acidophilus TaxID=1074 RepID=A0A212S7P2_RHOAC|nr:hypothetical protein [Rhodoblastus acidophilus]MCW2318301.1 hypothetical protein [Rhodoblastus acidophilus]RAI20366.1 hypothetical protein CH337_10225 [Rhodoblastus acidophilus]SNB81359.1 hypothetical protein SAMN06265338_11524 [Rhodoblastus acidophilus]